MGLRFLRLAAYATFFFPLLYFQGKRVRKSVPVLPEAKGLNGTMDGGDKPLKVLALGESTIAGVGVETNQEGFAGGLAEGLGEGTGRAIHWQVVARSGYNVRRVRDELLIQTEDLSPDIIVIGIGGNDAFEFRFPWDFRKDVESLLNDLRKRFPTEPVYFVNMPPVRDFVAFTPQMQYVLGEWMDLLGEELVDVSQAHENVYFNSKIIRLTDWLQYLPEGKSTDYFFSDGVHPSGFTYQLLGKKMAEFILTT